MTKQTNGNGSYASYTYDSRNRPTVIDHMKSDTVTRIAKEQTTYDFASNVTQKIIAGVTTNYQYDDIDQLTQEAVVSGTTTNYTYDANGNRSTKAIVGGITETYTNDDADKLTSVSVGGSTTKSFTYDVNGNTHIVTTSAGPTTLDYDYENGLSTITYPSLTTNTFTYNGLDTRVGKTDSAGTSNYRRNGIGVTAPVINDGAIAYTPGLSTHTSTQDRFQHTDRLGSNIRQTNPSEGVTSNVSWDAFGNVTSTTNSQTGPFGFAGAWGYQGDSSGLQLLGHRFYDSSTGRFLTRDNSKDGNNWYTYGINNPERWADPLGLVVIGISGGGQVGLGISGSISSGIFIDLSNWHIGFTRSYGYGLGAGGYVGLGVGPSIDPYGHIDGDTHSSGNAVGVATPVFSYEASGSGGKYGHGITIGPGAVAMAYAEKRESDTLDLGTLGNFWERLKRAWQESWY